MSKRIPQQSKLRKPDLRGLVIPTRDVVKCRTGALGYSRSIAEAMTKNNPAVEKTECLICDAYHVTERAS